MYQTWLAKPPAPHPRTGSSSSHELLETPSIDRAHIGTSPSFSEKPAISSLNPGMTWPAI
ncbi:MAG: hypothetical protein JW720_03690 [Sedimentisphaerales bacterium]|nr:hypothetical protein [Sedimentisphaerales bacterium]